MLFIVNIFFPGIGTIINAVACGSVNTTGVIIGIVQILTCWLLLGWIWSIIWGWFIYEKGG